MTLIDTRTVHHADHPSLSQRLRAWLAQLVADMCSTDGAPDDPTASFTSQEWADLPAHHPVSDE